MRVKSLEVQNFRTLQSIKLTFPHYYCAICGKNDSGKTNLVEAIRAMVLDKQRTWYFEEEDLSIKTDFTKWVESETGKRSIRICLTFSANKESDAGLYEFLVTYLKMDDILDELVFSVIHCVSDANPSEETTIRVGEREFDGIIAQEVLKKIQSSALVLFHNSTRPDARLRYSTAFREISGQHADDIEKLNEYIRRQLKKIASSWQSDISELLGRLEQRYKVGLSLPDLNLTHLPFDITLGDAKLDVSLDNWGSGTRNRTLILLTLLKARQISESGKSASKITPVIIIEEPESFLHPSAQAEFSRVIQDLAHEWQIQVITTTHSAYMLSKDHPEANILLERELSYKQMRSTRRIETSNENWMEPFSMVLGLGVGEFSAWKSLFFAQSDKILLVEGKIDQDYMDLLKDEAHGAKRLSFSGEIFPFDGIGNLKNGVLLNFLRNKYKRIMILYDLDVNDQIEPLLKGLGYEKGIGYHPIGLPSAGKKNIEGLVPDAVKQVIYANHHSIVDQATNGTQDEKKIAKQRLKQLIFQEFKLKATPQNDMFKHFYEVAKVVNKALT